LSAKPGVENIAEGILTAGVVVPLIIIDGLDVRFVEIESDGHFQFCSGTKVERVNTFHYIAGVASTEAHYGAVNAKKLNVSQDQARRRCRLNGDAVEGQTRGPVSNKVVDIVIPKTWLAVGIAKVV
jgi:hypothetical protein